MPSEAQVDRALALVQKGGGNYEYFFAELSKPSWIVPLAKRGRFDHPPSLERVSEDTYRIPAWLEGQYLLRMAPIAPDDVANAIGPACFASDNPLVHTLLIEIASLLEAPQARDITEKEIGWLAKQHSLYTLYPQKAASLVLHLLDVGELGTALRFTRTLLQTRAPEPKVPGKAIELEDGSTYTYQPSPDPEGRMDPVWTQMFQSKVLPSLVIRAGVQIIGDLAKNLDTAVAIHSAHHEDKGEDYSTIWRPYLDHRTHQGTLDEVVSAVTDSIKLLVEEVPRSETEIIRILSNYKWAIFARLSAFTLRVAPNVDQDALSAYVSDLSRFTDPFANPEFRELLTAKALELPQSLLEVILERIATGPDLKAYEDRWARDGYPEDVDAKRAALISQWQLDWLASLRPALTGESLARLEQLEKELRPAELRYHMRGTVMNVQEHSPSDLETFNKKSVTEILQYLKEWIPPPPADDPFDRPSRSGLGTTLSGWVSDDPIRASGAITHFLDSDLDPIYITSMLDSFSSLLKEKRDFDVYSVAAAARWVAESTDAMQSDKDGQWDRATWNWAHMSAARFMTELMLHTELLDLQRAAELFQSVRSLCFVPRPTQEEEVEYKKQSSRYASFALNTPRPVGVEAVIRFGRWLKLATPEHEFNPEVLKPILSILEEKLDPEKEPSVGVREMLGMQFGLLAWLNLDWFNSVIPKLFPGKRVQDRFAWNAYLLYGRMVVQTLPAMRVRYTIAINKLEKASTSFEEADRILASHLMHFYASGAIELGDPLLASFFSNASPVLRKQGFGDIGWSLGQEKGSISEAVQSRFMALSDHRWNALRESSTTEASELESFGWWINCGAFPEAWVVKRAIEIIEKQGSLQPDFAVAESFASLSSRYPYEAVRIVHMLLAADKDGWSIHGWNQHLGTILKTALADGEDARKEATAMIDLLAVRGFRGYRSMLKSPA